MTEAKQKIAVVLAAHGIRGQVTLRSYLHPPDQLFSLPSVTDAMGMRVFSLTFKGRKQLAFIASIEGIDSRNAAEALKGLELYSPITETREDFLDLIGLEARLLDGNRYGRVIGQYNFGAGDILDIELDAGGSEMLPLNEHFVGDVQLDEGYLIVLPPEYLEAR